MQKLVSVKKAETLTLNHIFHWLIDDKHFHWSLAILALLNCQFMRHFFSLYFLFYFYLCDSLFRDKKRKKVEMGKRQKTERSLLG